MFHGEHQTNSQYNKTPNKMKKNLYKMALLAALGLASTMSVQAASYTGGDLLVGFTTGTGNDVIYDLGGESLLTQGETWDLSSLLTGINLNTVSWGVVGASTTPKIEYTTLQDPPTLISVAAFNAAKNPLTAIAQNFSGAATAAGQSISIASTDDNSWNRQMVSPTLPTQYANSEGSPDVIGLSSVTLNQVNQGSDTTVTPLSNFSLANNGILQYGTVAVPEPTTYGLLAGAGLLAVSLRNQFRRKQA
jgi:hypothetical protein